MAKSNWKAFPHPDKAYDYAGDKLAKAWTKLHAGDQEPFPDEKHGWVASASGSIVSPVSPRCKDNTM